MWSAGIIIFLGVFWATGDIIASGGFALGYYVIVGALSFGLGKLGAKILPRVVVQLLLAVGVIVLACVSMGRGDIIAAIASEKIALLYYIVVGLLIVAVGVVPLDRTPWVALHLAIALGLIVYDCLRYYYNGEFGFPIDFVGYYIGIISSIVVLGAMSFRPWAWKSRASLHVVVAVGVIAFACCMGKSEGDGEERQDALIADEGNKTQTNDGARPGKDEKVRDFALKESPLLWKTYQYLTQAIGDQDKRIAELRKTLEMFRGDADKDADLRKLLQTRNELVRSRNIIKAKLDEAYLQSRKFAAAPNRKEFEQQKDKSVKEGLAEAKRILTRIKNMKTK